VPPVQAVSRAVTPVAVLLTVLGGQGLALAAVQGAAPTTQALTSGTFAVIPTTAAGTPAAGALTLTYGTLAPPPQYFDAVNTGTLTLTATSYGVAVSGGGVLGAPSIALSACVGGTWNTTLATCTGGVATALGSWTSASSTPIASTATPAAVGARLNIKATLSNGGVLGANTVAVITTTVSSGSPRQVRAATTTNS
jgi:hypothetical protein